MSWKIVSVEERLAEVRGPKILVAGVPKIGKTSLMHTLSTAQLERTAFVDIEAGDIALGDLGGFAHIRPPEGGHFAWPDLVDIACLLGGPNEGHDETLPYNPKHYARVAAARSADLDVSEFDIFFIDSISAASQLCLTWAAQQPEALTKDGKPDTRGMYGHAGRHMVMWLTQLQSVRKKTVVYSCIMERQEDDYGRKSWGLQIAGGMAGRALPGIVDEIVTLATIEREDEEPARFFVCKQDNPEKFPAGDRSGKLDMLESPHLGDLITKLTAKPEAAKPPNRRKAA